MYFLFLVYRLPPESTLTATPFPSTTLFRSSRHGGKFRAVEQHQRALSHRAAPAGRRRELLRKPRPRPRRTRLGGAARARRDVRVELDLRADPRDAQCEAGVRRIA